MKRSIMLAAFAATLAVSPAQASDVGFDVNIRVGNQPPPVVPVPVPARVPVVVIEEPPVFLYPPELGFYVAVGVPYDIVFIQGTYYLFRDNVWYRAPHYSGPWVVTRHKHLPPGLRKHKFDRVRVIRDREFRVFERDRDHFRGKHFRPEKELRKHREKEHGKEERKFEKDERRGRGKHGGRGED